MSRGLNSGKSCLLIICFIALLSARMDGSTQPWRQVVLRDLCVTEGRLTEYSPGYLGIEDARTRAVQGYNSGHAAELFFRYLGPSAVQLPLESGITRTQIGLKMRAQNSCNLVYVMWRISPEPQLVVSIKSNPRQVTSAQCHNRGYHNVTPDKQVNVAAVKIGSAHSLRAEINGTELSVAADGQIVWDGHLDASAFEFDGPVGFRTDNGNFEAQFFAFQEAGPIGCPQVDPE